MAEPNHTCRTCGRTPDGVRVDNNLRRGECLRCYAYRWRTGKQRPLDIALALARKADAASPAAKRSRGQAQAQRAYLLTDCERCGKPGVERHHIDGDTSNNVRSNILIVCRRCHMAVDGRLEKLREIGRRHRPKPPLVPCPNCSGLHRSLSVRLCGACCQYKRNHGYPPAAAQRRSRANLPNKCLNCGKAHKPMSNGLCSRCYGYKRKMGKTRPARLFGS